MRTPFVNAFIKKTMDAKNGGVKEFKISVSEAESIVLELSKIITDNHLISFEDLRDFLRKHS